MITARQLQRRTLLRAARSCCWCILPPPPTNSTAVFPLSWVGGPAGLSSGTATSLPDQTLPSSAASSSASSVPIRPPTVHKFLSDVFICGCIDALPNVTTINELLRWYLPSIQPLTPDVGLDDWLSKSATEKTSLCDGGWGQIDTELQKWFAKWNLARDFRENFAKNDQHLTTLEQAGIRTLEQWSQLAPDERPQLPGSVIAHVNTAVTNWRAFLQWAEDVRMHATTKQGFSPARLTTYHEELGQLGSIRQAEVKKIHQMILQGANSNIKENHPIYIIIAAPGQGKSLFLDEVCVSVNEAAASGTGHHHAVPITFNSHSPSPLQANECGSVESVTAAFWGRVAVALARGHGCADAAQSFRKFPFSRFIGISEVIHLVDVLKLKRLVIIADEFPKLTHALNGQPYETTAISGITAVMCHLGWELVVSGLSRADVLQVSSVCRRPIETTVLQLASQCTREQFVKFGDEIQAAYVKGTTTAYTFPTAIYEWAKLCPGLLGLWLKRCKKSEFILRPGQGGINTCWDLNPPVVQKLIHRELKRNPMRKSSRLEDFWRQVAAADTVHEAQDICKFADLEDMGWIAHTGWTTGVLNPYYLVHLQIHDIPCKAALRRARLAFDVTRWDFDAKGAALVELVTAALVLRANHSPHPILVSDLINRVCGRPAVGVFCSSDDESLSMTTSDALHVTLRAGDVTTVAAFPCDETGKNIDAEERRRRRVMNLEALKTASVLRFSEKFNAGCDVCLIGDLEGGKKVLFFFKCRYHQPGDDTAFHSEMMRRNARDVVDGVLEYVVEAEIARICFVYCMTTTFATTSECSWQPEDQNHHTKQHFNAQCQELSKRGCEVSFHIVHDEFPDSIECPNTSWQLLCMQSLYHAIPELE